MLSTTPTPSAAPQEEYHITLMDILDDAIAVYAAMEDNRFLGKILPRWYSKLPILLAAKNNCPSSDPAQAQQQLMTNIMALRYPDAAGAPTTNVERTELRKLEILLEMLKICVRYERRLLSLTAAHLALQPLREMFLRAFPYPSKLLPHLQALLDRQELQRLRTEAARVLPVNTTPSAALPTNGNGATVSRFSRQFKPAATSAPIPIPSAFESSRYNFR